MRGSSTEMDKHSRAAHVESKSPLAISSHIKLELPAFFARRTAAGPETAEGDSLVGVAKNKKNMSLPSLK